MVGWHRSFSGNPPAYGLASDRECRSSYSCWSYCPDLISTVVDCCSCSYSEGDNSGGFAACSVDPDFGL